jgi:mycoredoxin
MTATGQVPIEFYTRPGCPYSFRLRRALRRRRLAFEEVNIWKDPEAAGIATGRRP